jgi:hypothetical protein
LIIVTLIRQSKSGGKHHGEEPFHCLTKMKRTLPLFSSWGVTNWKTPACQNPASVESCVGPKKVRARLQKFSSASLKNLV